MLLTCKKKNKFLHLHEIVEIKKMMKKIERKNDHRGNKKHSENADNSSSVTFDMWCWPYDKVKNVDVI